MPKKPTKKKSDESQKLLKIIAKGDGLLKKGKAKKALIEYECALEIDSNHEGIYDKLIAAHDATKNEWGMDDFAKSVTWAMKKQEQDNPPIKQVHARLNPKWKDATELAYIILTDGDLAKVDEAIEKLAGMGEIATRAVIGFLIDLKNAGKKQEEPEAK